MLAISAWFALAPRLFADELPRTRWQILPLAELFYAEDRDGHVVTAAFDMPCGATPIGAVLVDRGTKLQVAAMVARPLAACARLPERRYFKLPFLDTTAWKVIEPMRGDLDGIRVAELNVTSVLSPNGKGTSLNVDVPCGVVPTGMLVMPDPVHPASMRFQLAAIGFKMAPRRIAALCGGVDTVANQQGAPVPAKGTVQVAGLSGKGSYRVMPRKVGDLRKLGVLQLRGIDRVDHARGIVHFTHRCYEVPVGVAVVPDRGGSAVAVAVASYINAPCVSRQARVGSMPAVRGQLSLAEAGLSRRDMVRIRDARVMGASEIRKYRLGQLLVHRGTPAGNPGDISGIVVTSGPASAATGKHLPRGWFAFSARSGSDQGRMALRTAGIVGKAAPMVAHGRPLRLQITSAL